jgi:hypothetical protein
MKIPTTFKQTVMEITPTWAAEVLETRNTRNRDINKFRVAVYAQDMKNGAWGFSAQGISFDDQGCLLDGQHRLTAIVTTGITVRMCVAFGVPRNQKTADGFDLDGMDVLDRQYARSIGQQLTIAHGVPNGKLVAAICGCIRTIASGTRSQSITTAQTLRIIDIYYPSIEAVVGRGWVSGDKKCSVLGVLTLFNAAWPDEERAFSTGLAKMADLPARSPILALRRWLMSHAGQLGGGTQRAKLMSVTASAVMKFHHKKVCEKLYENDECLNELKASQKDKMRKVAALVGG